MPPMERPRRPVLQLIIPTYNRPQFRSWDSSAGLFEVDGIHSRRIRQPRPEDDGPRAPPSISSFVFANELLPPQPQHIDMDISIRLGRPRDLPHLKKVQIASTLNLRTSVRLRTWLPWRARHTTYTRELWNHCLIKGMLWVAVAELATGENWIVGFAIGILKDDWNKEERRDDVLYIAIHVHASVRRMGVGSQLLKQAEQHLWERGFDYLVASAFREEPWKEPEETFLKKNDFERVNLLGFQRRCPCPHIMDKIHILNGELSKIQPGMERALWIKSLPPRLGSKRYGDSTPPSDESTPESYEWPSLRRLLLEDDYVDD
ncbi:uncharacterized protein B0T23DRAFT_47057 [Neurospora hispaniola]|uniref:N-acetyltransferase domain-containing protein n=1 Tax=Neurospora hispaniola TaxID=588809 RepID=A0AAJ0HYT2_9PEZI|nr:hypothetical protein B0T23DRAFT_47057 [Neurospora hispaniola]